MQSYLIFTFIILLWIYFVWSRRKYYQLSFQMGGPWTLPLLGDLNVATNKNVLNVFAKYKEKYGSSFISWAFTLPLLYVGNSDDIQTILTSQECIDKSRVYKAADIMLGSPGILSIKNPEWAIHRKILAPAYSVKKLVNYTSIFNEQTDFLVHEKLKNESLKGEFVEIENLIMNCFLDITIETTMGTKMGIQRGKNAEMLKVYKTILHGMAEFLFDVKYQNEFLYKFAPFHKNLDKAAVSAKNFVSMIVEQKLRSETMHNNESSFDDKETPEIFIDTVIKSYKEGKISLQDVYTECTHVILTSFESVSRAVIHCCICLALYPKYQEEAFKEIVSYYPDKNFSTNLENIKNLPFLEMVFKESMRFFTPVPLIARTTSSELRFRNFTIPTGVEIILDIMSVHRDPRVWGDDADEFNPYRFSPEKIEKRHSYAFLPFSKGPRQCMGIQYAYFVCKMLLAKIIRNFHLEIDMKYEDLKLVNNIVLQFEKSPKFRFNIRGK